MLTEIRDIYRQSKKPVDDFWTEWISRPPAAAVVWLLRDTRITPNQVTLLALLVCVGAAGAFACWPGYLGLVVAGVTFQCSYVLDCADGQLARHRGIASELGRELDFLTDELKAYLIWSAVSVRLWLERGDVTLLLLGIGGLAVLAANLSLTKFLRNPAFPDAPVADEGRSPRGGPLGIAAWAGKWLIQYPRYLLVLCLLGHIDWFFAIYLTAQLLMLARSMMRLTLVVARSR